MMTFGRKPSHWSGKPWKLARMSSFIGVSPLLRCAMASAVMAALTACGQSSTLTNAPASAAGADSASARPAVTLVAMKSVVAMGTPATLQWNASNAQSCVASGGWSGTQPTSGTASTDPLTANTSYTLTCTGPGGSAAQSAEVVVTTQNPTVTLTASPTTVAAGSMATLSWSSEYATACSASGGWTGQLATSGTWSTGALPNTTDFVVTCTGAGGSAMQSATVTVSGLPPTLTLSASPSTVNAGAGSVL